MSEGDSATLDVLVQPRASREKLGPLHDGRLKVAVTAPPVDGEANAAVIELVAKKLGVARSAIEVVAGASSRRKTLRIAGISRAALVALGFAAAAILAGACSGTEGTLAVALATAPGSTVLDDVRTLRLTVTTSPPTVTTATRGDNGFELSLDLDASGDSAGLVVEGLDASGALVACGESPAFPLGAIDATVTVYMAAPRSFAAAPVSLDTARRDVAAAALTYGAVVAGGAGADGTPSTSIAIYNAYSHTLVQGMPLPEARAGAAIAAASGGIVLLYGGRGPSGDADQFWRFDTNVAPSGSYAVLNEHVGFPRSDAQLLAVTATDYLLTGAPPLETTGGAFTARTEAPGLNAGGVAVVASDGVATAIFPGETIVRYRAGAFDTLAQPGKLGGVVVATAGGKVAMLGGGTSVDARDALLIDPATGGATTVANALSTKRVLPSVALTPRYIVVAGGTDDSDTGSPSADLLDATTLALVATVPMAAQPGARAIALPTEQVLLIGGSGPTAVLQLFTPDPPL